MLFFFLFNYEKFPLKAKATTIESIAPSGEARSSNPFCYSKVENKNNKISV
ncbi:hypothetical protein TTX_1190 [Thermoproteus tenax Kra 1]|uniref:Uncharacterized protein n=1 Tax=Thermoproteus tenax (strain ATCC 35583 / DSM 2078 / JCM 9277 / NBRC 100435 / Kra 1) TaxID=768679 RepID=G4RJT5_THETK|nr:hypothetical protein TTX_1190 [Thermoproteus tenax Kra 1]